VKNPFLNERERRLRAFWRLLLQYVLFINGTVVLAAVLGLASLPVFESTGLGEDPTGTLAASPAFQTTSYVVASLVAGYSSTGSGGSNSASVWPWAPC
jgi:hypothetical protein